jgi:HEAT repeat protein
MAALSLLLAAPAAALAHGGSYSGPVTGGPAKGPQVPPGTADPPTPTTRWETWWAANKEFFLRLGEEMRNDDGPTSRGLTGEKSETKQSLKEQREKRDAEVRDALAPVFIEALADESFEVRTAAAIALGKSGNALGSKPLREASIKDTHKDVRDSCILALGMLGRPADIAFLEARLHDPKENTRHRSFAAFGLGLTGGEDAAAALLTFVDGKTDQSDGKPSIAFVHEQPPLVSSVFVAMGMSGDARVLPTLREALISQHFDDNTRAFVILSLGRMKDRDSMADLVKILTTEKDNGLRRSAAISLGKMAKPDDKAVVEALLGAVKGDSDEMVRQFSAISLGTVADADAKARLRKLFPEAPEIAKPFIAISLALGKDPEAPLMLRTELLKEKDYSARSAYCISLALLQDNTASPLIAKQLEERSSVWLQGYAALSLGMLRCVDAADMLHTRLKTESDPRLRANLAVALGLMHDARAKEYLIATLKKTDSTIYERGGAAMAMGVLRMGETYTDLLEIYCNKKDQDMIRAFSMVGLGMIADPNPYSKLSRFAIDNNYSLSIDPLNEVLSIL